MYKPRLHPIIMSQIRKQVFYRGNVQGVGFRYNALRCARGLPVTGFVRNLGDGRVELVVEGESKDVTNLLDQIRTSMQQNIDEETTETADPTREFSDFSIRP